MNSQRGFTLIELLISLSIFGLVSVIAFSGLDSALKARSSTQRQAERLIQLEKSFNLLRQDLEQALPRAIRDQLGDRDPKNAFQQTADGVAFTRGGRPNPLGLPRSSLDRIAYGVEDDTLVRTRWQVLDQPADPVTSRLPLLTEVDGLGFRFMSTDKRWLDQWPPPNSQSPNAELPIAVEVTLELTDLGPISRIFLLAF